MTIHIGRRINGMSPLCETAVAQQRSSVHAVLTGTSVPDEKFCPECLQKLVKHHQHEQSGQSDRVNWEKIKVLIKEGRWKRIESHLGLPELCRTDPSVHAHLEQYLRGEKALECALAQTVCTLVAQSKTLAKELMHRGLNESQRDMLVRVGLDTLGEQKP